MDLVRLLESIYLFFYMYLCSFCDSLRCCGDVFVFSTHCGEPFGKEVIKLHPSLKSYDDRTRALATVVRFLAEKDVITGLRNEVLM